MYSDHIRKTKLFDGKRGDILGSPGLVRFPYRAGPLPRVAGAWSKGRPFFLDFLLQGGTLDQHPMLFCSFPPVPPSLFYLLCFFSCFALTGAKNPRPRCTMEDAVSEDDFSLNPGAPAGAGGEEEEDDEAPALRAALHFSVGEICSAEEGKLPMTGGAVSTLAEVGSTTRTTGAGERCSQHGLYPRGLFFKPFFQNLK